LKFQSVIGQSGLVNSFLPGKLEPNSTKKEMVSVNQSKIFFD